MSPHWTLRPGTPADMDALVAIESASNSSPWLAGAFEVEFERSVSRTLVAERAGALVGFVVYWVVVDEAHILNVAVTPSERRQGLGMELVSAAIAGAESAGAGYLMLEVRAGNTPALALYSRHGFREVSQRPNYYRDNGETAVIMGLLLGEPNSDVDA